MATRQKIASCTKLTAETDIVEIIEGDWIGIALNDKNPDTGTIPGFVVNSSKIAFAFRDVLDRIGKKLRDKERLGIN